MEQKIAVVHFRADWLSVTENWLFGQIRSLPSSIENTIVCERRQNAGQFDLPQIYCLGDEIVPLRLWNIALQRLRLRRHLGYLSRIIRDCKADILHSHFGHYGWMNLRSMDSSVKHVVTFYGLDVNWLPSIDRRWRVRYRELFEQADRILCEGPHMAKCIVALGCPEDKVVVHHLGVDVETISFRPRTVLPGDTLRILIAASFRQKKGIPYAVEAIGRLQKSIPLQVTIIGDADSEPRNRAEKCSILQTLEKYGLGSKVRMLGYQPHDVFLDEAYQHHLFLSPSVTADDGDTEGGAPVSIIEMLASGMPVVSTIHCDIPEVVQNGTSGLLAAERDVEGLIEHVLWLYNHPDTWPGITAAGRRHVEIEFNSRVQGARLAELYQRLMA